MRNLNFRCLDVLASPDAGRLFGPALDTVTAQGTAIGATIAALTAATGDQLAVKNCPLEKVARILSFWSDVQVAGTGRIRSARLHDNVQGIRFDTVIGDLRPYMPWGVSQRVYPNDVLIVELGGSAVGGDLETIMLLIYYEDLPGISARFISVDELKRRGTNVSMVENTITTGTGGSYQGSEAINVEFDQFHAGGQYALVGYLTDTEMGAVCWRGPDTGNLRVAGPGEETERELTADWFVRLSRAFDLPLIPVISAENKAATAVDVVCDENGADPTITSIFVELAK
ncbi:MAG TPA: hypothetical protein VGJ39_01225 [Vicinamibacterales bacterium]